jgi:hypothetical protein
MDDALLSRLVDSFGPGTVFQDDDDAAEDTALAALTACV